MTVKFERQHFNAVAKILGENAPIEDITSLDLWLRINRAFTEYFQEGNENFDADRFKDGILRHIPGSVHVTGLDVL